MKIFEDPELSRFKIGVPCSDFGHRLLQEKSNQIHESCFLRLTTKLERGVPVKKNQLIAR